MRAFFVRPFGTKEGIDFDDVERLLIRPALMRLRNEHEISIDGGTTGEFIRQGNIREDMFRLLVTADLVVADVSIHNPNAFYELGIRHALRHQHTFLLRARATEAKYPFDLQTDRYFTYDAANLASSVDALAAALRSTLNADPQYRDSPVFQLLPKLKPHDRAVLIPVPVDFQEDVKLAKSRGERGDLRLLAEEAQGFEWETEGLRLVGEAQFRLKAYPGAKETFETIRKAVPNDVRANLRLGTIYQKLAGMAPDKEALLARSDQAIERALGAAMSPADRAEAFSLLGSNAKTRWQDEWRDAASEGRGRRALGSAHLGDALDSYLKAFAEDLGGYYPGANALAMLRIQSELAKGQPETWEAAFEDPDKAGGALKDRELCAKRIAASLNLTLAIDPVFRIKEDDGDPWRAITRADVSFLTSDKPTRVENEYRKALARVRNEPFSIAAVRRNIEMFEALGLLGANVEAALRVIDEALADAGKMPAVQERLARVVLFTGHMVDAPDRPSEKTRFPRTAKAEATACALIEAALRDEMAAPEGVSLGIAGGACGADILFHEMCAALGIPTRLYLALPPDRFQVESVQHGGPGWVERYRALLERLPARVMQDDKTLPRWLADKADYNIWRRNNLWMMFNALALYPRHLTLIALYNRERESDGPGGTAHLVQTAQRWGFKTIELDGRKLLEP